MLKKKNRKNNTSVVGLDLDPAHIAAAEVSVNGHISVQRGAIAELRPASCATARSPTRSPSPRP